MSICYHGKMSKLYHLNGGGIGGEWGVKKGTLLVIKLHKHYLKTRIHIDRNISTKQTFEKKVNVMHGQMF